MVLKHPVSRSSRTSSLKVVLTFTYGLEMHEGLPWTRRLDLRFGAWSKACLHIIHPRLACRWGRKYEYWKAQRFKWRWLWRLTKLWRARNKAKWFFLQGGWRTWWRWRHHRRVWREYEGPQGRGLDRYYWRGNATLLETLDAIADLRGDPREYLYRPKWDYSGVPKYITKKYGLWYITHHYSFKLSLRPSLCRWREMIGFNEKYLETHYERVPTWESLTMGLTLGSFFPTRRVTLKEALIKKYPHAKEMIGNYNIFYVLHYVAIYLWRTGAEEDALTEMIREAVDHAYETGRLPILTRTLEDYDSVNELLRKRIRRG